jgi:ADP-heptose:LPS heptosyltransferase
MKNIDSDKIKKILVVQLGPFGDALLTTAYFEALRKKFPKSKIYYLIKEPFHKIIANHPLIDHIIRIPKKKGIRYFWERIKAIKKIRKNKFDIVIDQQNKPSTKQFVFFQKLNIKWVIKIPHLILFIILNQIETLKLVTAR